MRERERERATDKIDDYLLTYCVYGSAVFLYNNRRVDCFYCHLDLIGK